MLLRYYLTSRSIPKNSETSKKAKTWSVTRPRTPRIIQPPGRTHPEDHMTPAREVLPPRSRTIPTDCQSTIYQDLSDNDRCSRTDHRKRPKMHRNGTKSQPLNSNMSKCRTQTHSHYSLINARLRLECTPIANNAPTNRPMAKYVEKSPGLH